MSHHTLKASMQEHHYTTKCHFFGKNCKVTQSHKLVSPFRQKHCCKHFFSESACVSVPRNNVCKNPSISKLAITVSHSPRKKAAPISPWPPRQCCSFVLCSTFQLNYYFLVLKFFHRGIRLLHNYLTIKLIINKAQFHL